MISQKSIARQTAIGFVAVTARELALLPSRISRRTSRLSRLVSAVIGGITELTVVIGLSVSYLLGPRPRSHQGFLRVGKTDAPAMPAPSAAPPAPELAPPIAKPAAPAWDRSLADRKLWLLKRSGMFGDDTKGATVERACNSDDLRKAYKLVHDVYLGTGFIEPEAAGMRLRIFETSPDMATFVAKRDGQVVGVLSILADTPELGLPSDDAFGEELRTLRTTRQRLCEITNQAVAKEYRKSAVPTELMRCAMAHATAGGFDEIIATVSPSHNCFYELLGFRKIGSERTYSDKLHDPVIALGMEVDQYRRPPSGLNDAEQFIHHFLAGGNRYLPLVEDWAEKARRHFLDAELLAQLFVTERNFISECSPAELGVLQRRWGHELFSEVTGDLFMPSMEKLVEAAMPSLATLGRKNGAAHSETDR